MSYSVTSWFQAQLELYQSEPKRVLTIGGSDYSQYVLRWPAIRRSWQDVRPVGVTISLGNESQTFNFFRTDTVNMRKTCVVKFGFTHPTSGDELLTIYSGTVEKVRWNGGEVQLQLLDKLKSFTEKVIGSTTSAVSYTGSNYLVSDLGWYICTSHGGLSAVASTSNPDIDYASFLAWAAVFSGDSVFMRAKFEGVKVNEALRKLARYTDSAIFIENDKVVFQRFSDASSNEVLIDSNRIVSDLALEISDSELINKAWVYADYNADSDNWGINVFSVSSSSVDSFGLRENIDKDETFWYVSSATALNLAQRRTNFRALPYQRYSFDTTLVPLHRQIGETVRIADTLLNVTSASTWRMTEYNIDLDKGISKLTVDNAQVLGSFVLDDATNGLLDQSYNPLL